ncbi:MAG: ATP-binding protein [Lentimicrobium sp.]
MHALKQSLQAIPFWAYILVFLTILVNAVYLNYKGQYPDDGMILKSENGQWITDNFRHGSTAYIAGIRSGDIILSIDDYPVEIWFDGNLGLRAKDNAIYKINRKGRLTEIQVTMGSYFSGVPGFLWLIFIVQALFSIACLYILVKKPHEKSVRLFFIYLQFFTVTINSWSIPFPDFLAIAACNVFLLSSCLLGSVLIHFHLVFPKPVKLLSRFNRFPLVFYIAGVIVFIPFSVIQYYWATSDPEIGPLYGIMDRIGLGWLTLTFLLALATAIYQFVTNEDTLSRNQLRIVIIGSFFGFITPIFYALFYPYINQLNNFPMLIMIPNGIGSLIMISCILIAIFRYRIWDVEVIIRKVILYIGATLVIMLTYLLLIWLVHRLTIRMTDFTRFLILGISVITFLLLRDRIQQLIERLFHRETYDSATVVSDFEAKLSGIYQSDELKQKIVQSLDDIFHFKSFGFILKKYGLTYEPAYVFGTESPVTKTISEINPELEERLQKAKVFSPEELHHIPPILNETTGELVVPLISDGLPNGFFICGQKKSERIYSRQDISILSLLARRVTALLHTASLYQKDLDRQLLLERERARISQDMHDDIGAGLTKIAMISEAPVKSGDNVNESGERMVRVASSARDMISRLNVIVWALNPKNDNLDSLIAYSRRYFGEYLENIGISFTTDVPDAIPEITLSPDTRRNLFYAMQEAIHNGVKHGACSEILLEVRINHQIMEITITDNGKGFDITKVTSGGNGLYNMKKRAEDLGGSFRIQSSVGRGTVVIFTVNL